jgi:hypothetical protein
MAVLNISWETLSRIPPIEKPVVTGETVSTDESEPAVAPETPPAKTTDKPYFVYVQDPAGGGSFDTVEKVILADDKVAIGSHAFHMVKMTPEDAAADPVLKGKGKSTPRFMLVTADQKTITVLESDRLKGPGAPWDAMVATANKFYKQSLDKTVRELREVLNEYDKINSERSVLDEKEKRLAADKKTSDADKKDIETKRNALAAREKKAQEQEKALFAMKPKAA